MERGPEQSLRDLARDGREWLSLGVVTAIEDHDAWGIRLDVTLVPSGRTVQARPGFTACGSSGKGAWVPFEVDAEVLVLLPDGDPNRAVAFHGPTSSPQRPPSGWDNDRVEIVHGGGLEVRATEGASVQKVVTEDLLPDLLTIMTELQSVLSGLGLTLPSMAQFLLDLAVAYRSTALKTE